MKYLFILGNNISLSMAEILNKIECRAYKYLGFSVFLVEVDKELLILELIKKLGGTIKIAQVEEETGKNDNEILKVIKKMLPVEHVGKYKFGFSYYGAGKMNTKRIAMETKKMLKNNSISCRWVTSKENTLSSVVVGQNKLDSVGLEVIIVQAGNRLMIAKTETVQDYKALSYRDYNRPARDDKSGMLPPKLAQIMINLAGLKNKKEQVLLDAFCGSGTVLMEASLMGIQNLVGADLSVKAVKDTEINTNWIENKFDVKNLDYKLYHKSATELSNVLNPGSIDVIVTEPYLGPQRGWLDIRKIKNELEELYSKTIIEFGKVLKKDGKVVMVWPVFKTDDKKQGGSFINPSYPGFEIVNPLPNDLQNKKDPEQSLRNTIIYGRTGQRIWREIVVMKKK